MKRRYLLLVLLLPLLLGSTILFLISFHAVDPWRSLFVNLAAGLLGSMITVFYIDTIIRRNKKAELVKVLNHVGRQVNILANGTTASVRLALGLRLPRLSEAELQAFQDPGSMRMMILGVIENQLLPRISRLREMNQRDWKTFANNMANSVQDAERLLSLFSRNLDPEIMSLILDIHEKARALLLQYRTWPDCLGVPLRELKPNNQGESMIPFFEAIYESIIQEAEQLLKICANLVRAIDAHFPSKPQR